MQIKYSPDADVLMVRLRERKLVDSVDIAEGLIAHYAEDGSVLEIEILDASKVVEIQTEEIEFISARPRTTPVIPSLQSRLPYPEAYLSPPRCYTHRGRPEPFPL